MMKLSRFLFGALQSVKRAHDRIFAQGTFRSEPTAALTVGEMGTGGTFELGEGQVTSPLPGNLKTFVQ